MANAEPAQENRCVNRSIATQCEPIAASRPRGSRIDYSKCEDREWIVDIGSGNDLVQRNTLPKAMRDDIAPVETMWRFYTANGTCETDEVCLLQFDHFDEQIDPYVLPATPNVLTIGRRCALLGLISTGRFFIPNRRCSILKGRKSRSLCKISYFGAGLRRTYH